MAKAITIPKDKSSFPEYLNFYKLRELGLSHIEKLGSDIWTDYNLHDPGITILEVLCYAITDLGYRTNFDIKDLLARSNGEKKLAVKTIFNKPFDDNFYSAAQILSCNPLTVTDYRKLFIDIPGVKNAWLEKSDMQEVKIWIDCDKKELSASLPEGDDLSKQLKLNGLYKICVEVEPIVLLDACGHEIHSHEDIVKKIYEVFHQHRNLCEDIRDVCIYGEEDIAICADIELVNDADPEEVMLQISLKVEEFLSPSLRFYTLQEMIANGKSVEEIFEGRPLTMDNHQVNDDCLELLPNKGFIDVDELKKLDPKTNLHVSDVHNVIMQVEGVQAIRKLVLVNYINNLPQTKGEEWCLNLTEGYRPHFTIDSSKVNLFKGPLFFPFDKDILKQRYAEEKRAKIKACLDPYQLDLPIPDGTYHDLKDYTSILHEFPLTYGIGKEGINQPPTLLRKAQAKQLQGYLLFFDQILTNYLAQISHIRDLFAMRRDDDPDREFAKSTYFNQTLLDIPGAEELIKNFEACDTECQGDAIPEDYPGYLNYITEKTTDYQKRRNRFLDHLLARFSESFTDYAMQMYKMQDVDRDEQLIIDNKASFLECYPEISRNRGKGFDILKRPEWDTDNVSGVKKRISALLGIRNANRRTLSSGEIVNEEESYYLQFEACESSILKSTVAFKDESLANQAASEMKSLLADKNNYQILHYTIPSLGGYSYVIIDESGDSIARSPKHFTNKKTLNADIEQLFQLFVENPDPIVFPNEPKRFDYQVVDANSNVFLVSQKTYDTKEEAEKSIELLKVQAASKDYYCGKNDLVEDAEEYAFAIIKSEEECAEIILQSNRYDSYDDCHDAMQCFINDGFLGDIDNQIIREDECFEYWLYDALRESVIFKSFRGYKTHNLALDYPDSINPTSGYHKFLQLAVDIDYYNNIEKEGKYGFELHTEKIQQKSKSGFVIFKGRDDQFYFRLKATNHKIILQSEGYKTLQACKKGINSVKRHASDDANYDQRTAKNGQDYFVLKAKNNEIIMVSETYTSKAGMENGIESVKSNASGKGNVVNVHIEAIHPYYYDTEQEREDRKWAIKYYLDEVPHAAVVIGGEPGDFVLEIKDSDGKTMLISPPENGEFTYKTEALAQRAHQKIRRRASEADLRHVVLLDDLEGELPYSFLIKDRDNSIIAEHPHRYETTEERDIAIQVLLHGIQNQVVSYRHLQEGEGYRYELLSIGNDVLMRSEVVFPDKQSSEEGWNILLSRACAWSNYKLTDSGDSTEDADGQNEFRYSFSLTGEAGEVIANHTRKYKTASERDLALQSVINYTCYTEFREKISGSSGSYTYALKGKEDSILLESSNYYADESSAMAAFKAMTELAKERANYNLLSEDYRFEIRNQDNEVVAQPPDSYVFVSENERDAAIELIMAYLRDDQVVFDIENTGGAFYSEVSDHHNNLLLRGTVLSPSEEKADRELERLIGGKNAENVVPFAANPDHYVAFENEEEICPFGFYIKDDLGQQMAIHPNRYHTQTDVQQAQLNALSWLADFTKLKENIIKIHKWRLLKDWKDEVLLQIDNSCLSLHGIEHFKLLALERSNFEVIRKDNLHILILKDEEGSLIAKHPKYLANTHAANELIDEIILFIRLNAGWYDEPAQNEEFIIYNESGQPMLKSEEGFHNEESLLRAYELGISKSNFFLIDHKIEPEGTEESATEPTFEYSFELRDNETTLATHLNTYTDEDQRDTALDNLIISLQTDWLSSKLESITDTWYYEFCDFSGKALLSSKNENEFLTSQEAEDNYDKFMQLASDRANYKSVLRYQPIDTENKECRYSFIVINSASDGEETLFYHGAEYTCLLERDNNIEFVLDLLKPKQFKSGIEGTSCGYIFQMSYTYFPEETEEGYESKESEEVIITIESNKHYPSSGDARRAINELAELLKEEENYLEPADNENVIWVISNWQKQIIAYIYADADCQEVRSALIEYLNDTKVQVSYSIIKQNSGARYYLKNEQEILLKTSIAHNENQEDCERDDSEHICEKSDLVSVLGQQNESYRKIGGINHCFHGFELLDNKGGVLASHDKLYYSGSKRESVISQIQKLLNSEGLHLLEHILLRPRHEDNEGADEFLPLPFLCTDNNGELCTKLSDPYSFRMTIVLPFWPKRFNDPQFREFMETTLRRESPAHILPRICWLDTCQMNEFERAYQRWLKTLDIKNNHCDALSSRNDLIAILKTLKSKYPEAQLFSCKGENNNNNVVILDNTRLG